MAETRAALDRLCQANPQYYAADRQLLYARTLEADGEQAKARQEYENLLSEHNPGIEVKVRYANALLLWDDKESAQTLIQQVLVQISHMPRHSHTLNKQWITQAKALKSQLSIQ